MRFRFSNAPFFTFNNPIYVKYVAEYQGDIVSEAPLGLEKEMYITVINDKYVIITKRFESVMEDRLTLANNPFPSVVYIAKYCIYCTLDIIDFNEKVSINPLEAANINDVASNESISLSGKGTVVGIIDTGIDYTNREFQTSDGNTRILRIWDQSLPRETTTTGQDSISWGTEYTNEDINKALAAQRAGQDPYSIVASKDDIGHGTAMAGVIGASGFDPEIKGAAPQCEFVVVKLGRDLVSERLTETKELYDMASIMSAINYILDFALSENKPTVIYMPLGTTLGNHRFNGILESYIDDVCSNVGVSVVNSSGDEGEGRNHAFSILEGNGDLKETQLYVDSQKFLMLDLWTLKPNKVSISIISPTGESSGTIPALFKQQDVSKFVIEETEVLIQYYLPEDLSGDELISVYFAGLKPGIWKIRVYGNYVLDGRYDIWMFSRKMLKGATSLTSPCTCGTITNPSTSRYSLTISNYNQNNITVYPKSGLATTSIQAFEIDVAAGGVDVKCIFLNNGRVYITGTSVSAAVAAGAALLLFEWGIVKGNDPYMYSNTLKSYILRGTYRRKNDIYPNIEWGYGILDLLGVFTNL
ncbi:S8 family peptidase [Inconstantimicrobium porci]|uniref:S8 family peptidase n=1 Tax=Inconstantimicrobium porci TaxID=2652291 RepID=A0A7X2T197_9CLOT|nr:S8 family peptidase [Inconstantimicrobium porci]MSR91441.1 S8 family peptidase [Inconstantimicrobium porci]